MSEPAHVELSNQVIRRRLDERRRPNIPWTSAKPVSDPEDNAAMLRLACALNTPALSSPALRKDDRVSHLQISARDGRWYLRRTDQPASGERCYEHAADAVASMRLTAVFMLDSGWLTTRPDEGLDWLGTIQRRGLDELADAINRSYGTAGPAGRA